MTNSTFTKEEKAAMRAAAAEAKAAKAGADMEAACLAAISGLSGTDKELAQTLHQLVQQHTGLKAKTWYGMPAYSNAEDKVVVFFQAAAKFKVRYATIGFQDAAALDDDSFWATSFAVTALDDRSTQRLIELLQKTTA